MLGLLNNGFLKAVAFLNIGLWRDQFGYYPWHGSSGIWHGGIVTRYFSVKEVELIKKFSEGYFEAFLAF